MSANISFNPVQTTVASGTFNSKSTGYIQGTALDQPAIRFSLAGGVLNSTETLPMWGGVGIYEDIPSSSYSTTAPSSVLGTVVGRATTLAAHTTGDLTGFSVFDQNSAMINFPQSPVPLAGSGMQVNYYRLGSGARIAVACDPSLASITGGVITQQVSWDFTNQLLIPYLGTLTISSGTYNNTTGLVTLTMSAPVTFSAGDAVIISGLGGSGNYASLAGTFTSLSASGTTVTYNAGAGIGASAITSGSLTLGSGASTALPVEVLDVDVGNSMTVTYSGGYATWNYGGTCAIILI